jgi:acyl-CoA thioester hydrolase
MTTTLNDLLASYPVIIEFPVHWGDMDAFRHVNNIHYLKYWESARIRYFESIGIFEEMEKHNIGPILASQNCIYRFPLTYPDTVSVGCRVVDLQADRFLMNYVIVSHTAEKIAARGEGMVVSYDYNALQKAPLPPAIRAAIQQLEKIPPPTG